MKDNFLGAYKMGKAFLEIFRFDPDTLSESSFDKFLVPIVDKDSVLHALLYIYENIDSSLAFRYGCRYKRCGLCGVDINGKPSLACLSLIYENDHLIIKPLKKLKIVKDLVIDRSFIPILYSKYSLFILQENTWTEQIFVSQYFHDLSGCLECLRCLSACPHWDLKDDSSFGGPFVFVKLAQLHLHPKNNIDRKKQAEKLGIMNCSSCKQLCSSQTGCNLCRKAISILTS